MGAVRFQPPHQQLGIGAQSSQRIAQLMHKRAQLLVLATQFTLKLLAFQIPAEGMADGCGAATDFCVDVGGPVLGALEVDSERTENQACVLQWEPATMRIRDSQVGVGISWQQGQVSCGPLPDQNKGWTAGFRWGAEVKPQMSNRATSDLGG